LRGTNITCNDGQSHFYFRETHNELHAFARVGPYIISICLSKRSNHIVFVHIIHIHTLCYLSI